MQYYHWFHESVGLLRYIVNFTLTAVAGLFLFILLFALTGISVYLIKKNDLEECIPQQSNLIYLNSSSKQWHKIQRRK
jgi:hypothetical protein